MNWGQMSQPGRERVLSDDGEIGSYTESYQKVPQGTYSYVLTHTYQRSRTYKVVWDSPTENWRDAINSGTILCSDLLEASFTGSYLPTTYRVKARTGSQQVIYLGANRGGVFGIDQAMPSFDQAIAWAAPDEGSLRDEAVTLSFARVDASELEVLASLGEMPETVEWFKDVLKRLMAITTAMKQRKYVELLKLSKDWIRKPRTKRSKDFALKSEDLWMEWRYAIRPLVFEVQAYLAALDSKVEKATRKTARKRTLANSTNTEALNFPAILPVQVLRETTFSRSISAGVLYALQPDRMRWWSHLGLDAPTSAAWAIWPLSFVYDWFFNVGEWIASWEPRVGLTPLTNWAVETQTVEVNEVVIPGTITSSTWVGYSILEQSVTGLGSRYSKVLLKTRWANPDRQVLPTFRLKDLDTAQILDLTIIGRKLISGLFR